MLDSLLLTLVVENGPRGLGVGLSRIFMLLLLWGVIVLVRRHYRNKKPKT